MASRLNMERNPHLIQVLDVGMQEGRRVELRHADW